MCSTRPMSRFIAIDTRQHSRTWHNRTTLPIRLKLATQSGSKKDEKKRNEKRETRLDKQSSWEWTQLFGNRYNTIDYSGCNKKEDRKQPNERASEHKHRDDAQRGPANLDTGDAIVIRIEAMPFLSYTKAPKKWLIKSDCSTSTRSAINGDTLPCCHSKHTIDYMQRLQVQHSRTPSDSWPLVMWWLN